MRVPPLKTVGVLRCELLAGARCHADHKRHAELPPRHMPDRGGGVEDLVQRKQREIHRHQLHDRAHASRRGTDAGPRETGFAQWCVSDAGFAEFIHQAFGDRITSAISTYVLAHQEHALIADHSVADRLLDRLAVSDPDRFSGGRGGCGRGRRFAEDMIGKIRDRLPRPGLGEPYSLGDLRVYLRLDFLHIRRMDQVVFQQPALKPDDRPALSPSLDLFLVAVKLGIEHRMGTEAIGLALQEHRFPCLTDAGDGPACRRLDGDHIHAIHLLRLDAVSRGLVVNVGFRLGPRERRSHGIAVVLADEEHRQIPELRKVHGLMELTFRHGPLAKETSGNVGLGAQPVGQCQSHRERQAAAHDGVAAVEIGRGIEKMHRPAAPARTAFGLAVHFSHHSGHRHPPHQGMPVFAIGGDNAVGLGQHRDDARRDRLFSIIEVQEAADFFLGVEFGAFVLEFAHPYHVREQLQHMRPVEFRLVDHSHVSSVSSVEISPSGRPSSRAFRSRRMILPDRVFGSVFRNTISRGATAGPSFLRAWPRTLRSRSSDA